VSGLTQLKWKKTRRAFGARTLSNERGRWKKGKKLTSRALPQHYWRIACATARELNFTTIWGRRRRQVSANTHKTPNPRNKHKKPKKKQKKTPHTQTPHPPPPKPPNPNKMSLTVKNTCTGPFHERGPEKSRREFRLTHLVKENAGAKDELKARSKRK